MVRTERDGDVLVIVIDNPPVNAGSLEVRRGVLEAVTLLQASPDLQAAVLIGAGSTFVAGSDLREFGKPLQAPILPDVIAAIEACPKPVVAALHGAALGGGLELALGCDARVAAVKTIVGLPEVTLGIIPGAGGTQRVPRRTGAARAIRMVCGGERISAAEARELGLVDAVTDGDLRSAAIIHARSLAGRKCRIRDESVPEEEPQAIDAAVQAALKAGKRRPAVVAAIEAIRAAASLPFDAALAQEREAFQQLRLSREAFALRHQFFAERDAMKLPKELQASPRSLQTVAIIGAGTMGTGIAISALDAGLDVVLLEQDDAALQRGSERIRAHYSSRVVSGKMAAEKAVAAASRLDATVDWKQLRRADLVIEAVFEELAVKQEVFARIDAHARQGAVLATNTSYLDVDAIAQATTRPQDVLGLHFFSPANVMRLLEVVRATRTAPDVLATGVELAKRLRKQPVVAGNAFGFIGNRIYNAYRKQCEFMLEEGAWPEQVDVALQAFGMAMGPFAVSDLAGLDIPWRMRKAQAATRDPRERYVAILDRLCEQGRYGQKTGAGYYTYTDGKRSATTDDIVHRIIEQASVERGIQRRAFSNEEIQRRALAAMANEAALLLSEGVAIRASDIDVVLVQGYGFPRWEGGPVFWACQLGAKTLQETMDELEQLSGGGFIRGNAALLMD
ncbi:MAG TPA: 3-hydroxyacyl-CoA dehydrogenase [Oxalobacteraceae bacterium]|nr:3-hydroxyacyl-CoA dehydrogenase [Oxalobacteraceae bacterium]